MKKVYVLVLIDEYDNQEIRVFENREDARTELKENWMNYENSWIQETIIR